jgi:hypothetical protein
MLLRGTPVVALAARTLGFLGKRLSDPAAHGAAFLFEIINDISHPA